MFSPKMNHPQRQAPPKKPASHEAKKQFVVIIVMSLVLLLLYYGLIAVFHSELITRAVMTAYMLCFATLLISYIVYNRGFVNKDVTEDMLPKDWSPQQKREFVEGNKRRAEKSRWMLVLIVPFVVVFMAEALYLFVWDGWLSRLLLS